MNNKRLWKLPRISHICTSAGLLPSEWPPTFSDLWCFILGVGAVLAHVLADGAIPILYCTHFTKLSLSPAEKKYTQVDKESLAIITTLLYFRQYLLGHTFSIILITSPFSISFLPPCRAIPYLASTRIQRWALVGMTTCSPTSNLDADALMISCPADNKAISYCHSKADRSKPGLTQILCFQMSATLYYMVGLLGLRRKNLSLTFVEDWNWVLCTIVYYEEIM